MNFDKQTVFPAGKYWIGDPCYTMEDYWTEICDDFFFADKVEVGDSCNEGEYNLKHNVGKIFVGNTAYGDGHYQDNFGNGYSVDAGCIGIIPMNIIEQNNDPGDIQLLGTVVDFDVDFVVCIRDGVFQFGNIVIDTIGEKLKVEDNHWSDANYHDSLADSWYMTEI